MTQHSTNQMYPGMGCSATEFFVSNGAVKIISNAQVLPFAEISTEHQQILEAEINSNIEVKLHLFDMHPNSKMKRLEQFANCRFGGLDFTGDIQDGILQDGEYWACPNRGSCKSEGILCKLPSFNGQQLSKDDVNLIQQCATSKKNEVIAEDLNLAYGSFHKAKKSMYAKLGVQTKQELTLIGFLLNLI